MKNTRRTLLFLICSASLLLNGCAHGLSSAPSSLAEPTASSIRILTIGTADSGGTMYPVGQALAQTISESDTRIKLNLSASNGSSSNVRSLTNGDIDLGLVSGDVAFEAVNGQGEFAQQPAHKLRVIAAVYPSLSNWMSLSDSGLSYVHDLKGKRIGVGPQDSTTELSASIILSSMGITAENSAITNCGLGSGADQVKNKLLDSVHGFAGIPIRGLSELADALPCTILKYTEEELRTIIRGNAFYYQDVIPAGTYKGQTEDIPTFGIKCLLCVSADMDEDLVYELTSILARSAGSLKELHGALSSMERKGFMCDELPIELHPGAERFYRENNMLPAS